MKTTKQMAAETLREMLAPQWSAATFCAMINDPGSAGYDLRRMLGQLEAAIDSYRYAHEKKLGPS